MDGPLSLFSVRSPSSESTDKVKKKVDAFSEKVFSERCGEGRSDGLERQMAAPEAVGGNGGGKGREGGGEGGRI